MDRLEIPTETCIVYYEKISCKYKKPLEVPTQTCNHKNLMILIYIYISMILHWNQRNRSKGGSVGHIAQILYIGYITKIYLLCTAKQRDRFVIPNVKFITKLSVLNRRNPSLSTKMVGRGNTRYPHRGRLEIAIEICIIYMYHENDSLNLSNRSLSIGGRQWQYTHKGRLGIPTVACIV